MKPTRSSLLPASLALAALASSPAAFAQSAGFFSYDNVGTGNNDANVGLNSTKSYLQAYTFNKTANVTVNGVTFIGTGIGTTNPTATGVFTTSGLGNTYPGGGTNPGGAFGTFTNRFVYGSGTTAEVFNFTNLTPGKTYVVTFYGKSWEAAGGRRQNLSASGASTGTLANWDQDNGATGQGSLNVLRYTFQAGSASQTINFAPIVNGTTAHQYGYAIEDVFGGTFASTHSSGTDWTSSTWSNTAPNSVGATAVLGLQGAPATLNLDSDVTLGSLSVDGTNGWTLSSSGGSTLTMQSDIGGNAILSPSAGTFTATNNLVLNSPLVKLGNGTATLSGAVSGSGGIALGGGTLNLDGSVSNTGNTTVSAGTLNINGVMSAPTLFSLGGGTLNIAANANSTAGSFVISTGAVLNLGSLSDYGVASAMGTRAESSDTNADSDSATAGIGLHFRGGTLQYTGSTPQSTNRHVRISTAGATFDASGSVPSATLSFTRSGPNVNLFDTGGTRTLTLTGSNTGDNTFSLILENQGGSATSLTKTGPGTWIYNGLGTYTGTTTVREGKLILAGNRTANAGGITVGNTAGITATLEQTAGSFTTTGNQLLIGNGSGPGIYNLSAGTLTGSASGNRGVMLGVNNGTPGTFNLSGTGVLNMGSSNLQVARSENSAATGATGNYNQTGGTATFGSIGIGGAFAANNANNIGNFNVSGGTFSASSWTNNVIAGGTGSTANLTLGGTAQVTLPAFPAKVGTVNLTFDGGTLLPLAASASFLGGLDTATITANGAKFDVGSGKDITASQVFTGPGGLTKLGVGTMALTSAQSYTGTTTVNSGTLLVNGLAGDVAVTSAAAFGGTGAVGAITTSVGSILIPGGPTAAGTLSPSSLSLSGNSLINSEFGVSSDLISVSSPGGLNIGGGIFNLYATGGLTPLTTNGTYTLLDYDTSFSGSIANLSIGNAQPGKFYSIADNTGATTIELTIADATTSAWNGAGDGTTWSDNANWANNLSPNALGAVALFSGTGTAVSLDGSKTVSNINFDNAASYTLSGSPITLNNGVASAVVSAVSGSHTVNSALLLSTDLNLTPATGTSLSLAGGVNGLKNIAMTGEGSVTLGGTSTFTGLAVTAGTIDLAGTGTFGVLGVTGGSAILSGSNTFSSLSVTGGSVTLSGTNSYGAIDLVSGTVNVGSGGTTGNIGSGNVSISGNSALVFNRSNDFTVATNLLGSGAVVTKLGAGVLTLSGTNTVGSSAGGSVNLNEGTLSYGSADALPATVNLSLGGGTLDLNGFNTSVGTLTATAGSITDNSAGAGTSVLTLPQTGNATFSGQFADGSTRKLGVTKTGTGILTIDGSSPSTATGGFTIASGSVRLSKTAGVDALAGPITIGDTVGGDILQLGNSHQISDASVLTFTSGGAGNSAFFRLSGFDETVRGIQSSVGNAAVIENEGPAGVATLTVDTAGASHTYDGILRDRSNGANTGTFALVKTGDGALTIANTANVAPISHAGGTTLNGGSLTFSDLANSSSPIVNNLTSADLVINQTTRTGTFSGLISGAGFTKTGTAALNLSNGGNNFANSGIVFNEGTILMSGNGPAGDGAGQFTCVGPADPANVITVGSGRTLAINNTAPLGQSTLQSAFAPSLVIEAGGKLTGGGFVAFIPNLTLNGGTVEIGNGAGTGGFNTNLGFLGTVVVGGTSPSSIVTTGTGGNAVASLGVVTATAGTTFQVADATGDAAADLVISTILRNAVANASALTKTGTGTLSLLGANTYTGGTNISAGTVIAANEAALGAGPLNLTGGTLDINGLATVASATFGPAGNLALQLSGATTRGSDYDALNVTGALVLDGTVTVTLDGLTPVLGQSFDLVDAASTNVAAFDVATDLVLPTLDPGLAWDRSAFASTGVVTVISANPVVSYAESFGLTGNDALPDADPDGDGISNVLEYAFGISPTANNGAEYRGVATTSAGALSLTYRRPTTLPAGLTAASYKVQLNTLGLDGANNWTDAVLNTDYTESVSSSGGVDTITINLTGAVSGKKFARIAVTY